MLTCLTGGIGITNSECECILEGLSDEQKAAIKISNSGLYLDDLEGGVHMKALKYADACEGLYSLGTGAIAGAAKRLEDDLIVALNNKYAKSKKTYIGDIGRMSYAATLNDAHRWQGIRVAPWDYSDGLMTLNRFSICVTQTVNFTLRVIRSLVGSDVVMGDEIASYPVTATANMWFQYAPPTPLKMPLIFEGNPVQYWFVYDTTEGAVPFLPKDNKIVCAPCELKGGGSKQGDFVNVAGVGFASTSALNGAATDQWAHGLSLSVSIKCDNETLFCREYREDDAVAVTMAWAQLFKAGELLIEEVIKSPDVTRYTTMAREYLWGKRNHFRKEYETRITYLAETINVDASNCYVCRQNANDPFIAGIFK